jgi:DNA-binding transcriptional regulator LsrR (DeoR family)
MMAAMSQSPTQDEVVQAARSLGQAEFTRKDIAAQLGIKAPQLKDAFKAARQAGELEKIRDDESGTGHFRLADR